jgi:STAS domain
MSLPWGGAPVLVAGGEHGEERADPEPFLDGASVRPAAALMSRIRASGLRAISTSTCPCPVRSVQRPPLCDSSGLHTLLAAHKLATAAGGDMVLVIPGHAVLRVFTITGFDRIIPNFTSLEEALAQTSANGSDGHRRT